jgi:hypothetical protein
MKRIFSAIAAAILLPSVCCAEIWNVAEGDGGKIAGRWNVKVSGETISGNATMSTEGKPLTFGLSGIRKDGGYVINRVNSSDRKSCIYFGKPEGRNFSGNVVCNGVSKPWTVTRKR